jgi:hypothetical protein
MLAVFALVLSPWVIRNQRTFDRFEPSITMSGRNLFTGTYPASRGGSTLTDAQQPADIVAALPGLDEFQIDSVYNVAAARNLREHPAEQVPLALSKLVRCWFQVVEPGMFRPTFRSLMLNAPLLAAGLWGWRRLRSRRAPHLWLPVLVVAYAVLFQVLTIASVRYNLFAWPFMFMGVAVTVLGAWDAVTRRRAARAVPSRS